MSWGALQFERAEKRFLARAIGKMKNCFFYTEMFVLIDNLISWVCQIKLAMWHVGTLNILCKCFFLTIKTTTVEPRFFEHGIIRIPQFLELFPWSLGFALRNPYKLSRIFRTSIFRIPRFFEPYFRSLRLNTLDFLNFLWR